jgi:hypothetical protein
MKANDFCRFIEVPFEVCHGQPTMTCMDVIKKMNTVNIFLKNREETCSIYPDLAMDLKD